LGKGFSVIEMDDGTHRIASHRDCTALDASLVRVIPRDHRFVASAETGVVQVRDVTGALGRLFDQVGVRGVVLRPDRYVAGCLAANARETEAKDLLESIVRLSKLTSEPARRQLPVELAIA
jgi:hypothetical protein